MLVRRMRNGASLVLCCQGDELRLTRCGEYFRLHRHSDFLVTVGCGSQVGQYVGGRWVWISIGLLATQVKVQTDAPADVRVWSESQGEERAA